MEFSHVALNCKDLPATIEFYSTHFGFKVSRRLPIGEGKEIIFLYNGSVYLELFPTDDPNYASTTDGPNTTGIIRHFAFKVENVDNFINTLADKSIITLGPLDFDAFISGWRTVWLHDPNGHIVEVSQGYHD